MRPFPWLPWVNKLQLIVLAFAWLAVSVHRADAFQVLSESLSLDGTGIDSKRVVNHVEVLISDKDGYAAASGVQTTTTWTDAEGKKTLCSALLEWSPPVEVYRVKVAGYIPEVVKPLTVFLHDLLSDPALYTTPESYSVFSSKSIFQDETPIPGWARAEPDSASSAAASTNPLTPSGLSRRIQTRASGPMRRLFAKEDGGMDPKVLLLLHDQLNRVLEMQRWLNRTHLTSRKAHRTLGHIRRTLLAVKTPVYSYDRRYSEVDQQNNDLADIMSGVTQAGLEKRRDVVASKYQTSYTGNANIDIEKLWSNYSYKYADAFTKVQNDLLSADNRFEAFLASKDANQTLVTNELIRQLSQNASDFLKQQIQANQSLYNAVTNGAAIVKTANDTLRTNLRLIDNMNAVLKSALDQGNEYSKQMNDSIRALSATFSVNVGSSLGDLTKCFTDSDCSSCSALQKPVLCPTAASSPSFSTDCVNHDSACMLQRWIQSMNDTTRWMATALTNQMLHTQNMLQSFQAMNARLLDDYLGGTARKQLPTILADLAERLDDPANLIRLKPFHRSDRPVFPPLTRPSKSDPSMFQFSGALPDSMASLDDRDLETTLANIQVPTTSKANVRSYDASKDSVPRFLVLEWNALWTSTVRRTDTFASAEPEFAMNETTSRFAAMSDWLLPVSTTSSSPMDKIRGAYLNAFCGGSSTTTSSCSTTERSYLHYRRFSVFCNHESLKYLRNQNPTMDDWQKLIGPSGCTRGVDCHCWIRVDRNRCTLNPSAVLAQSTSTGPNGLGFPAFDNPSSPVSGSERLTTLSSSVYNSDGDMECVEGDENKWFVPVEQLDETQSLSTGAFTPVSSDTTLILDPAKRAASEWVTNIQVLNRELRGMCRYTSELARLDASSWRLRRRNANANTNTNTNEPGRFMTWTRWGPYDSDSWNYADPDSGQNTVPPYAGMLAFQSNSSRCAVTELGIQQENGVPFGASYDTWSLPKHFWTAFDAGTRVRSLAMKKTVDALRYGTIDEHVVVEKVPFVHEGTGRSPDPLYAETDATQFQLFAEGNKTGRLTQGWLPPIPTPPDSHWWRATSLFTSPFMLPVYRVERLSTTQQVKLRMGNDCPTSIRGKALDAASDASQVVEGQLPVAFYSLGFFDQLLREPECVVGYRAFVEPQCPVPDNELGARVFDVLESYWGKRPEESIRRHRVDYVFRPITEPAQTEPFCAVHAFDQITLAKRELDTPFSGTEWSALNANNTIEPRAATVSPEEFMRHLRPSVPRPERPPGEEAGCECDVARDEGLYGHPLATGTWCRLLAGHRVLHPKVAAQWVRIVPMIQPTLAPLDPPTVLYGTRADDGDATPLLVRSPNSGTVSSGFQTSITFPVRLPTRASQCTRSSNGESAAPSDNDEDVARSFSAACSLDAQPLFFLAPRRWKTVVRFDVPGEAVFSTQSNSYGSATPLRCPPPAWIDVRSQQPTRARATLDWELRMGQTRETQTLWTSRPWALRARLAPMTCDVDATAAASVADSLSRPWLDIPEVTFSAPGSRDRENDTAWANNPLVWAVFPFTLPTVSGRLVDAGCAWRVSLARLNDLAVPDEVPCWEMDLPMTRFGTDTTVPPNALTEAARMTDSVGVATSALELSRSWGDALVQQTTASTSVLDEYQAMLASRTVETKARSAAFQSVLLASSQQVIQVMQVMQASYAENPDLETNDAWYNLTNRLQILLATQQLMVRRISAFATFSIALNANISTLGDVYTQRLYERERARDAVLKTIADLFQRSQVVQNKSQELLRRQSQRVSWLNDVINATVHNVNSAIEEVRALQIANTSIIPMALRSFIPPPGFYGSFSYSKGGFDFFDSIWSGFLQGVEGALNSPAWVFNQLVKLAKMVLNKLGDLLSSILSFLLSILFFVLMLYLVYKLGQRLFCSRSEHRHRRSSNKRSRPPRSHRTYADAHPTASSSSSSSSLDAMELKRFLPIVHRISLRPRE